MIVTKGEKIKLDVDHKGVQENRQISLKKLKNQHKLMYIKKKQFFKNCNIFLFFIFYLIKVKNQVNLSFLCYLKRTN